MLSLDDSHVAAFKDFLGAHSVFIIAGHKEPDGDCLTSCLGIAAVLRTQKKPYHFFSAGPFKRGEIKQFEQLFPNKLPDTILSALNDVGLILLDCSDSERIGDINVDLKQLDTFIIDHHKTTEQSGRRRICDPTSPSTTLLVQQLYEKIAGDESGIEMDVQTANMLFFGLATDTNSFRYLSADSGAVFRCAARLVDHGADPRAIYDEISAGKAFLTRKLLGVMLGRAQQKFDGRLIFTYETLEDTHKCGQDGRDSDSLYQLLLAVDKTEAVVIVRQETAQKCTVGLRSRGALDVSVIAARLGGGGHKNAAGLTTEGTVDSVLSAILREFEDAFD